MEEPQHVLEVHGMMCQNSCGTTAQNALLQVPGVTKAVASFAEGKAFVWGNVVDPEKLIEALDLVGFDSNVFVESKNVSFDKTSSHTKKNKSVSFNPAAIKNAGNVDMSDGNCKIAELRVTGMSCASCVKNVETCLMKLSSVSSVKVALLAERAEVVFNPSTITPEKLVAEIDKIGYCSSVIKVISAGDAEKKEYMFDITGMSCANCASKIENSLRRAPGVVDAAVSCMTNKAKVTVNNSFPGSVGPRDLIALVSGLGYGCSLGSEETGERSSSHPELESWRRLLMIALIFGVPVVCLHLAMSQSMVLMMWLSQPAALPNDICHGAVTIGQIIMLLLNAPMQVIVGYRFYRAALLGAMHSSYGMDLLIVTGTTITFVYSLLTVIYSCESGIPNKHTFFETSGMLLMFVTIGKYLEAYAKGKTVSAISNLLKLQPTQALLVVGRHSSSSAPHYGSLISDNSDYFSTSNEKLDQISIDLVQKGDVLKVLPGSKIPTDGLIVFGTSYIDESMITGESVPVFRQSGDHVFGSTINQNGVIYIKATSVGSDSALAQIVRLVEAAQLNKAPVQAYADRIAGVFTPIVLTLALTTFCAWSFAASRHWIPRDWFEEEYGNPMLLSMLFAISVVVISCPCALGLATPTAIMVGTSVGAKNGILIKGGPAFESAHLITTVIFDKTGTLTVGKPVVTDEVVYDSASKEFVSYSCSNGGMTKRNEARSRLLRLAASAEQSSEHPLASAVLNASKELTMSLYALEENRFWCHPGKGVESFTPEGMVIVGNRNFLEEKGVPTTSNLDAALWDLEIQGKTAICVALNCNVIGIIGIADVVKPEASSTISSLKKMGIDVWMVTGDNRTTAEAIADSLEIPKERVLAGVLPSEKVTKVVELQKQQQFVAMIGDGVNDSPALARANVGIAIGAGTHVAVDAADFVLVRNNLFDVVVALDLARVVFRRIRWNFLWALVYNVLAIPVAAGVFYPWTLKIIPPQYAGLSMALSSVSVVCSSLALHCYKRPTIEESASGSCIERAIRNLSYLKQKIKGISGLDKKGIYSPVPMDELEIVDSGSKLGLELGIGGMGGLRRVESDLDDNHIV